MVGSAASVDLLAGVLDAASLRHRAIAHNVANVNTPNFRRLEVTFENELAHSLRQGKPATAVKPQIVEGTPGDSRRLDGNTVDVDRELADLAKNGTLFAAAAQILANRLATMRSAITGR